MKIYNEVTSIFNETTGLWETISEDSYDYDGPVALAQGLPPNATAINAADTIADTIKTTAGYFTNGDGTLAGHEVWTGSLADSNEKYYYNVVQTDPSGSSAEVQFSVTYGHIAGSGSDTYGDTTNNPNTLNGEAEAIYRQLSNLLQEETEASGGFGIAKSCAQGLKSDSDLSSPGAGGVCWRIENSNENIGQQKDPYVYALIGKRSRFKDRMNKKSWTLTLKSYGGAADNLSGKGLESSTAVANTRYFTDDSAYNAPVATPGGPRYNIVSGALGVQWSGSAHATYGWFYPEMGIMLFSGEMLSASMPGFHDHATETRGPAYYTASFIGNANQGALLADDAISGVSLSGSGFAPNLDSKANSNNALKFVNNMRLNNTNTTLRLRSEEDQTQENYFCRVRAEQYNFSANPTFVSGSKNKLRNTDMAGNPQTFITGVGLYNSAGQLLAIAKLSSPLKKNFASEATIKVKLTY